MACHHGHDHRSIPWILDGKAYLDAAIATHRDRVRAIVDSSLSRADQSHPESPRTRQLDWEEVMSIEPDPHLEWYVIFFKGELQEDRLREVE